MKSSNGLPTSKKEQELFSIFVELYGAENCKSLEVIDGMCFDCLLSINNCLIDVEYDGWYWHKNRQEEDKRRDYYNIRHGYKVLRVISNGSMPSIQQIQNGVNCLVNNEHYVYKIILDDIDI